MPVSQFISFEDPFIPTVSFAFGGFGDLKIIGDVGVQHYTDDGRGELGVKNELSQGLTGNNKLDLSTAQAVVGTGPFEALDVANLGSEGVDGETVVTMAVGARFPFTDHISDGFTFEFPLSEERMIFRRRVTATLNYEF